jgi:hypothetical protein
LVTWSDDAIEPNSTFMRQRTHLRPALWILEDMNHSVFGWWKIFLTTRQRFLLRCRKGAQCLLDRSHERGRFVLASVTLTQLAEERRWPVPRRCRDTPLSPNRASPPLTFVIQSALCANVCGIGPRVQVAVRTSRRPSRQSKKLLWLPLFQEASGEFHSPIICQSASNPAV